MLRAIDSENAGASLKSHVILCLTIKSLATFCFN
jgi:hypothetical protein